ncbi:cell division protein ZapB [Pseudoalteromonas denitrificans]|uniref:Cell division protein ZapB n=1 Tax=Pseudoalteromonas denitrificans DSM 6059 TaxID=1123010 RepID=A0A1I1J9E6_9GAMM|nr:cell division protein ZapB [Pseudoalteromonas denitrificans]SFC45174.1 Protein of unknown function [Pseudoalteromonas denitrificans DSM 6059]
MINDTLPQLEKLINQLIEQNTQLKQDFSELKDLNAKLTDENETLLLEALEVDEKQKHATNTLEGLLQKLQSVQQAS